MAGGVTLGFLKYVLGFDSVSFNEGADAAEKKLKSMQKGFEKRAQSITNLGKSLTIGLTAPLTALAASGIAEARETAAAMAQVDAALKSTGGSAGVTAGQLKAASDALELNSLYEADTILNDVSARLLGFGNVTGATFSRAQQVIVDFATRSGKDLGAVTLLIGKALNDPAKGMAALVKAGVQLSDGQKAQIASMLALNDTAGAQAVILGALETKVKGAAAAAQNADPLNKLNDAYKQMAESVGTALLPILPPLTDALVSMLGAFSSLSPETQKWVVIAGATVAAIGPLLLGLGAIVSTVGTLLPVLAKVGPAMKLISAGFTMARVVGLAFLPALLPMLPVLAAVAGAAALVYATWKNWDKITGFISGIYTAAKTWIMDKLGAVFNWLKGKLEAVGGYFYDLYDKVVGHSYIPDMVDGIGANMARLDTLMVAKAAGATAATAEAFEALRDRVKGILTSLFPNEAAIAELKKKFETLDAALAAKMITPGNWLAARDRLNEEMAKLAANDDTKITGLPDLAQQIADWRDKSLDEDLAGGSEEATKRVADSFAQMAQSVGGAINNMKDAFSSGDFLDKVQAALDLVVSVIDAISKVGAAIESANGGGSGEFGGGRALGGPTVPGKSYVVGERGPEWFTPGRGHVTPMNDNASSRSVTIVPSKYFDVVVDSRAQAVAAPMVAQGAAAASRGAQTAIIRQQSRRVA